MPTTPLPIPETKPATEFIDGRLLQKMSPFGLHARVQGVVVAALIDWANELGRGRVGTEWDFDLTPPGEQTNRLVPDVAFLSYDRVSFEDDAGSQVPVVGPNVAIEILSQGQTLENSKRRIDIFRACGTNVVVLVDPSKEVAWIIDSSGTREIPRDGAIEHASMPAFRLPLARCFEKVPPGGRR